MDIIRKAFMPGDFKLDGQGAVTVAFAQLDVVDSDKDVSLPGSFPSGKSLPMSSYGHTSWAGALPIGKGSIREDGQWAIFDGQFLMSTEQGKNAYETVKAMGDLQEWSYGLNAVETSYGQKDGQQVRFIKRQDVFEVSPVLKGAGVGTHTRDIKSVGSGSELTYQEHLALGLRVVKSLAERSADRKAFRATDGRDLSTEVREQLAETAKSLGIVGKELDALLTVTDPAKQVEFARIHQETLLAIAIANGVPLA